MMQTLRSLLFTGVLLLTGVFTGTAQSCYQNPSLEGTSQPHVVPAPWVACYGSPDTQPGQWGITLPPSDGSTYVSFLQSGWAANGYTEGMTQLLVPCMVAGQTYTFNVDLAHTPIYNTADPNGCYSSLIVYGGSTSCAQTEILWTSGSFTHTNWQTYTITFTPTQNWCYLSFAPYFINVCGSTGFDYINCMMDNITCITLANGNLQGTAASCNNACDGQAWATVTSGTPPYTYQWMPGNLTTDTISSLCAGTYTCTITDANSQVIIDSITIAQPAAITTQSQSTNVTCFNACNGTATANASGGSGTFTYNWLPGNQTTQQITGLCPGSYTCVVTDGNGCTDSVQVNITGPSAALSAAITGTNISCFGSCNGTASVTASGGTPGYTYLWSPTGGNAASATSLCAGLYTCNITDANGCTSTQTISITSPPQVTLSAGTVTNVLCFGGSTGSASVNASGGTGTYTYLWQPTGGTGPNATNLPSGLYTISVVDGNGCPATQTINITQPPALASVAHGDTVCPNVPVYLNSGVFGGTAPYTFAWSSGQTTQQVYLNPPPTQNTTYTLVITDANGCQSTSTAFVEVGTIPFAAFTSNAPTGQMALVNGSAQLCFTDNSTNANNWGWYSSNGTTQQFIDTVPSPCFTVTDTGVFCTRLNVVSTEGCIDSADFCIEVEIVNYSIPNVFTPNGDGHNDGFFITTNGIKELECTIFDRWGVEVYKWNGVTASWNGITNTGKQAVDGVYYYALKMIDYSDKPIEAGGFLHLISGK